MESMQVRLFYFEISSAPWSSSTGVICKLMCTSNFYWINLFLQAAISDDILQKVAKEINLLETAFILEKNEPDTYSKG